MKSSYGPDWRHNTLERSRRSGNRRAASALLCFVALAVSACSISPGAFLETQPLDKDHVVATDARIRGMLTKDVGAFSITGSVDPKSITCTEPSPDVATSIATALSGSVNIFSKGSGSLTASQVEGLVQLGEKTAAIQLLRDKMYQTCLAYSNGAISGTTYSLIMSRLDDTIITMLLGETAAGAFGREGARSGGSATASLSVPSAAELKAHEDKLDEANTQLEAAKKTKTPDPDDIRRKTETREKALQALQLLKSRAGLAGAQTINVSGSGSLSPAPEAAVANSLLAMQRDFLLDDLGRAYIQSCLIELGQRSPANLAWAGGRGNINKIVGLDDPADFSDISPAGKEHIIHQMTADVRRIILADREKHSPTNYVIAAQAARSTALAMHCNQHLREILHASLQSVDAARQHSTKHWSQTEQARYDGIAARYKKEALGALNTVLKSCNEMQPGDKPEAVAAARDKCRSAAYAILQATDQP